MPDPYVPKRMPQRIAAKLRGQSYATFRERTVRAGLVEVDADGWIITASLEKLTGFISHEIYLWAERQLDAPRQRARAYGAKS